MVRRIPIAVIFGLALVLAACGGSEEENGSADETTTTTQPLSGTITVPQTEVPSTLELGSPYTFQMPEGTTSARFSFDVPAGAVVMMQATAAEQNTTSVEVAIGPAGQSVRAIQLLPGAVAEPFQYVTSEEGSGPWALEVRANPGDSVTLQVDAPLQADGGVAGDAGANQGVAQSIDLGSRLDGLLGDDDREDWYTIRLAGGDVVSITLDVPAGDAFGGVSANIVYNGVSVTSLSVNVGGEESVVQIFAQDQTGEAYLSVTGRGAYGFTIEAGPQRDGGTDGDAGDGLGTAKEAEYGTIAGIVGGEDTDDFFVLALPLDAVISGEITAAPDLIGSAWVELIHNGVALVSTNIGPGQTESWVYAMVNNPGDLLYFRVGGAVGVYTASLAAVTQPDGDGTGDASAEQSLATEITPEGGFDGILNGARQFDNRDWYQFTAVEAATLNVDLALDPTGDASIRMLIYDDGGSLVADVTVGPGGSNTASFEVVADTTYTMQLGTGGQAAYTVTFR